MVQCPFCKFHLCLTWQRIEFQLIGRLVTVLQAGDNSVNLSVVLDQCFTAEKFARILQKLRI